MKVTQRQIAEFAGISKQMVSAVRGCQRYLSRKNARNVADATGAPYSVMALKCGEVWYRALVDAYMNHRSAEGIE